MTWWEWTLVVCVIVGIPYCLFPVAARLWYRARWDRAGKGRHGTVVPEWVKRERYSREGDRVA